MKAQHTGVYLKLNKSADKDIIDRLQDQDNKQGYIKELIRTDAALDGLRHSFGNITQVKETYKEGETHGQCNNNNT